MKLKGYKFALFVENKYEDMEFWYPYYRLKEEGAEVTVIAPRRKEYRSKYGIPVNPDISINDARAGEFRGLIIPGGYSPDYMRRSPEMVGFVREVFAGNGIVAAICHAPWMLVSAGIVNGKKVTSFYSIKDDVVNAGGKWVDEEAVRDGTIITSRNPGDLPAFCRTIIETAFTIYNKEEPPAAQEA